MPVGEMCGVGWCHGSSEELGSKWEAAIPRMFLFLDPPFLSLGCCLSALLQSDCCQAA